MPQYLENNVIRVGDDGIFFLNSGSAPEPTGSNPATYQTSSLFFSLTGNIFHTPIDIDELKREGTYYPYIKFPINSTNNVYIRYITGSHLKSNHNIRGVDGISSSFSQLYYTGSDVTELRPLYYDVELSKGDNNETVTQKTYNALLARPIPFFSASYNGNNNIIFYYVMSGEKPIPTIPTSSDYNSSNLFVYENTLGSGSEGFIPQLNIPFSSASFRIHREGTGPKSDTIQFTVGSSSFGGTEDRVPYYISGSGEIGINTTSPKNKFDIKADTFKIRSEDGKREIEFADEGKLKTRKFANVGEGGDLEITGSELVLSYSPGTFETPVKARVGDIMGTIRWEDESYAVSVLRAAATPMQIEGKIVASGPAGVAGDLVFKLANPDVLDVGPVQIARLKSSGLDITGSFSASGNISASKFYGDGSGLTNVSTTINSGVISSSQHIFTAVTSSGNISSSGTIIANKLEADQLISHVGDANTGLQFSSDRVDIEGNNVTLANFSTTRIEFHKPITSSHNITLQGDLSASGDGYFGNEFYINNTRTIYRTSTDNFIGSEDRRFSTIGTTIKLNAPVTASGNISSSFTSTGSFGTVKVTNSLSSRQSFGISRLESFVLVCSDETSNLTTGIKKYSFQMPYRFTITKIKATVSTPPTGVGSNIAVDVDKSGNSLFSDGGGDVPTLIISPGATSATIESPQFDIGSGTITEVGIAEDEIVTVDIDAVGSSTAGKGLKVILIGYQTNPE